MSFVPEHVNDLAPNGKLRCVCNDISRNDIRTDPERL